MTRLPVRTGALRPQGRDEGLTLAELLVAMSILTMVMVATVTLTIGIQRTDAKSWGRTDDTLSAQYAIRVIERAVPYALRAEPFAEAMTSPVLGGSASSLAVLIRDPDADATSATVAADELVLVEFEVAGDRLVERRTPVAGVADATELRALLPLSAGCSGRTCETRVLVDGVQSGTGFTYLDAHGTEIDASAAVEAVEVTLVVRTSPQRQEIASTHSDRIHLKNS
ncbi:prepilin-type N-terminal cleavage/methylation domain-containing protein [Cellulomonas sp. RIT-PI-Y]|uniref:PulJ/GspJ family protein n=1 Tax=Cellulomonas sp. RIT-PI-Y TaxID=3035297 RepID=UPI0021DB2F6B|nr:prepilin-type N-terminal cleavage/methylation domain-containing protein [Cellulomonas sp. RIT-PI-Y]